MPDSLPPRSAREKVRPRRRGGREPPPSPLARARPPGSPRRDRPRASPTPRASARRGRLEREEPISAWEIGQVVGALYRDPDATEQDLGRLPGLVDLVFAPDGGDAPSGRRLVLTHDDVGNPGRVEPIFWTLMALSAALRRRAVRK